MLKRNFKKRGWHLKNGLLSCRKNMMPLLKRSTVSFLVMSILNNHWIQNNQGRGRGYQPKPKAEADNPYRDLSRLLWRSQKPNLIIVLLHIERILSFSLRHKMFSKFVPTLSFPPVLSDFSLSCYQKTARLPPSLTFSCFVSPCIQLFFRCLTRSTKQT